MMSSKNSRKIRSSPVRKEHLMKKPMRSISPIRSSSSSRVPSLKRISPGMKRGISASTTSKSMHPPRIRSVASSPHRSVSHHSVTRSPDDMMDRSRSYKRSKYEKRKDTSISPIRHPSPPTSREHRNTASYQDDRYIDRPIAREERLEPPPAKKKIRREPEKYSRDTSPTIMRKSNDIPFISDGSGLSVRSEIISHPPAMPVMSRNYLSHPTHNDRMEHNFRSHQSPPPTSSSQPKRQPPPPVAKSPYSNSDRYSNDIPASYSTVKDSKAYPLTLHERFSTVETARTEPRVRYSREDLEKITIDIHRHIREPSPTLRQIVNPSDVKLVRRANEGHRPIFDRDEIKQAPRDMRDEAYYEKKIPAETSYHPQSMRDIENYEVTRRRFDGHQPAFQTSAGRPISDRWEEPDDRKEEAPLDRDERERGYEKMHSKKAYVEVRNRSKSGDRDFRSERYSEEIPRSRSDYRDTHNLNIPSSDSRSHVIQHKETSHPDMRHKLMAKKERMLSPPHRSDSRSRYSSPPHEKRYSSDSYSRERHERRSPPFIPRKYVSRSRSHGREDKIPEYARKVDKYSYKSWPDKRESSHPGYISHGKESSESSYRGRGRPFRSSRGFRARGFRGFSRGGFRGRGSFSSSYRGSSGGFRGRGAPRRGRYSPHLWEHDLYSRLSPDRK